jgi:hypothetical protein
MTAKTGNGNSENQTTATARTDTGYRRNRQWDQQRQRIGLA